MGSALRRVDIFCAPENTHPKATRVCPLRCNTRQLTPLSGKGEQSTASLLAGSCSQRRLKCRRAAGRARVSVLKRPVSSVRMRLHSRRARSCAINWCMTPRCPQHIPPVRASQLLYYVVGMTASGLACSSGHHHGGGRATSFTAFASPVQT